MNQRKRPSVSLRITSADSPDGKSHVITATAPGIVVTIALEHGQWGPDDTSRLLESVAAAVRANGEPIVDDPHTSWKARGVPR